jgi:hypothetical protein
MFYLGIIFIFTYQHNYMAIQCKNCGISFEGNYCPNCGQSAQVHNIDTKYIWHDIQHGIFHINGGMLYTLKKLFVSPSATIRNFIKGKRVKHATPFSMLFIFSTFYAVFYHFLHISPKLGPANGDIDAVKVHDWIIEHYAFVQLFLVPVYALSTYLAFKKQGYNFVEHLAINSFTGTQRVALLFAFLPLLHLYNGTQTVNALQNFCAILTTAYIGYIYYHLFDCYAPAVRLGRILLSIIIVFAVYATLLVIASAVYVLAVA